MISKACQYSLRAVVFLASKADGKSRFNVKNIAKEIDAPEAFTAKTLQILNKHNIITSLKGPYGGFFIEEYQLDVPIINIVNAVDGLQVFVSCGLGMKQCNAKKPCPFHNEYKGLRAKMRATFEKTTIRFMADKLEGGGYFLKTVPPNKEKQEVEG
jgi:Rrf2 family transcriptional regulator, iron-sulfur cluster assembly transcription factor